MNYFKNIEELIIENEALIKEWGKKLSLKYGRGYDSSYLAKMRLFYLDFPILESVIPKLEKSNKINAF